jgi:hypothetical protein
VDFYVTKKRNRPAFVQRCVNKAHLHMRTLNTAEVRIVHMGRQWPYTDIDPSTKAAMKYLVRNESLVTWVQPIFGGVEDQFPTIYVRDDIYYVLSLRSMKMVFRHVRLSKGFVNRERTVFGEWKLRIPLCLLREKIRTQRRFDVSVFCNVLFFCHVCYIL